MKKLFRLSSGYANTANGKFLNLQQVYQCIKGDKGGKFLQKIAEIRAIQDEDYKTRHDKQKELKTQLPCIEFNAICNGSRSSANATTPTGYVIMDIDGLCKDDLATAKLMAETLRDNLIANNKLGVVMSFVSPSGEGVKALVRVPFVTIENFTDSFNCVKYYFEREYAIECDPAPKDISRVCFISHDADAKIDGDENKVFAFTLEDWKRVTENDIKNGKAAANTTNKGIGKNKGYVPCCYDHIKLQKFFRGYAAYISKHTPPVFSDYNSWIALGGHLYEIFGGDDEGLKIWEEISKYAPNYDPKIFTSKYKFNATPKNNGGGVLGLVYNQTSTYLPGFSAWFTHECYICGL